jgi:hypothetical protein
MPTLINQGKTEMSVQDHVGSSTNESGTGEKIDTPLTQPCSRTVLAMAHRDLLTKRNEVGANTVLGWHLSNLDQQLRNYQKETDPVARANLERFMGWTMDAIQRTA